MCVMCMAIDKSVSDHRFEIYSKHAEKVMEEFFQQVRAAVYACMRCDCMYEADCACSSCICVCI